MTLYILCTEEYRGFMMCLNKINPFVSFLDHSLIGATDSEEMKKLRRQATRVAYKKLFKQDCQWLSDDTAKAYEDKNVGVCQIFVNIGGQTITVNLSSSSTIDNLKIKINESGHQVDDCRLITAGGKQLEDGHTLAEYQLKDQTVFLLPRLRGC